MPGYLLSEEAQNDLKKISLYTQENWGKKQAKLYLVELAAGFENLARSPKLGRAREDIAKDLDSFPVGSHIVFCRIGTKCIEVARVLHARMDIKRHLT